MSNKLTFLRYICASLEILCCATHPFYKFEILLTGNYCNLANLSAAMDEKYGLGVWVYLDKTKRYYPHYPILNKENI